MKERPILFSAPMVRAILDGSKTQTRRIVKQSLERLGDGDWHAFDHKGINYRVNARHTTVAAWAHLLQFCPHGQPGDRLWVRENFQPFFADCVEHQGANWKTGKGYAVSYPATDGVKEFIDPDDNITSACKPSIHMPRWASRITLEITGVRVERLQDINHEDAMAEGMPWDDAVYDYSRLWNSINGAGSWEANPWVWVIEFKRVRP